MAKDERITKIMSEEFVCPLIISSLINNNKNVKFLKYGDIPSIMSEKLESLVNSEKKSNLRNIKQYLELAGLSFVSSAGIASTLPAIYSGFSKMQDVDKFS